MENQTLIFQEQRTRQTPAAPQNWHYVRRFDRIGIDDVALVGGKNASLGEMVRQLAPKGVRVPNGFAITADAYRYILDSAGAWKDLRAALDGLDPSDVADVSRRASTARNIVLNAPLPQDLQKEILDAYAWLANESGPGLSVAVRSSATAEDLPEASFAGQHDSFLNINGQASLLEACRRCFASLFTDRAILYRIENRFDHFKVYLSVGVQQMVRADMASSGVIFTIDPESGFRDVVLITGGWGLGENIVQGAINPDEFYVFKPTFQAGKRVVLRRVLGAKELKMLYAEAGAREPTRNVPTIEAERARYCLSDVEVLELADMALAVEHHYSERAGSAAPMDLEWAKDGFSGRLYIIQARPETVVARHSNDHLERYALCKPGHSIVSGRAVGERIATGRARVIHSNADLEQFETGEILVAETTSPDWGTVMKRAGGIVTDHGGRTCHAAIVARELGIPAIVGSSDATRVITTGMQLTVSCAEGAIGKVYDAILPFQMSEIELAELPRTKTQLMVNIGNPDAAFRTSFLPNDGVGLARMEFIITDAIRAHPMAFVHPEWITDVIERATLDKMTRGYARPEDFFVERLSEGIATIAAAFYPKPVIVRMSDFKSNEYAALLGGKVFETQEENPMIGFRGASRYAHPAYADGFALECRAAKRVREEMGLDNVRLMIPFCRRVEEGERVLAEMAKHGLTRGNNGLEIYVMCEIPNNVIQIDAFSKLFDGFSIGSNDLTQLVLGVDRGAEIVAFDFDERDEGVKEMIRMAVTGARRNGRHSGICGQAPSDYPNFTEFLVQIGIDSISVDPDVLLKTRELVARVEAKTQG
jgi:pyruvate,water dikinase